MDIVRKEFPDIVHRFDLTEKALAETGDPDEVIKVSFGGPTRHSISLGFWTSPKNGC